MKNKYKLLIIILLSLTGIFILSAFHFYICPLYFLFGIPCPTCGITRALLCLLKLDIVGSFYYHALWPFVIIFVLLLILNELKFIKLKNKYFYIFAIILIFYNIIRIIYGNSPIKISFYDSLIYKLFFSTIA